ncbi:P-loop ATPase, Sll1717 family [Bradyrhizobium canariense]|uniref:P-loop ATPase, Sll1717 family n=1 Tax=Bradyrhizobium canariense TaxID=255045 RepID=UPI001B8A3E73|nr:hypothetical protein [Bradyrhizobium canariense]MBR0949269.1 hypothetical protein [Bradyrhizobium canariense]
MHIPLALRKSLIQYVREEQPFGPPEADKIVEPQCAAALFDWNNSAFAQLLNGSQVIVGRRGSGKSALLSAFRSKRFLNDELESEDGRDYRGRYHLTAKTLLAVPDIYIEVDTPVEVDSLEAACAKRGTIPAIEILAMQWKRRVWLLVGRHIKATNAELFSALPAAARSYINSEDIGQENQGAITPNEFIGLLEAFLRERSLTCMVAFDNIERHKLEDAQNAVLAGLCAATGDIINSRRAPLDIKLCLPAEIFDHLDSFLFRPDKDLHRRQFLHWNAAELMHLAAQRLKLFLALHDPDEYDLVRDMKIAERNILKAFWLRYLPETITNSVGGKEDTFNYILRHTQLLPRQLLTILNNITLRSKRRGTDLFQEKFGDHEIIKGIEDSEFVNTRAVLVMFQSLYPNVREMFDVVMPRLRRSFPIGRLHAVFNESGKAFMEHSNGKPIKNGFLEFRRLMFSVGAIGLHIEAESTSTYSVARFEFNSKYKLNVGDKDTLCIHPMFSRIYNVEIADEKVILPRGSDFRLHET